MTIGHFAVESESQTSSPSHESESEGSSPSHQKSDSSPSPCHESYKSAIEDQKLRTRRNIRIQNTCKVHTV